MSVSKIPSDPLDVEKSWQLKMSLIFAVCFMLAFIALQLPHSLFAADLQASLGAGAAGVVVFWLYTKIKNRVGAKFG